MESMVVSRCQTSEFPPDLADHHLLFHVELSEDFKATTLKNMWSKNNSFPIEIAGSILSIPCSRTRTILRYSNQPHWAALMLPSWIHMPVPIHQCIWQSRSCPPVIFIGIILINPWIEGYLGIPTSIPPRCVLSPQTCWIPVIFTHQSHQSSNESLIRKATGCFTLSGWWFGTCFIFPYIGKNNPNWLSYFSEGLKPPTS